MRTNTITSWEALHSIGHSSKERASCRGTYYYLQVQSTSGFRVRFYRGTRVSLSNPMSQLSGSHFIKCFNCRAKKKPKKSLHLKEPSLLCRFPKFPFGDFDLLSIFFKSVLTSSMVMLDSRMVTVSCMAFIECKSPQRHLVMHLKVFSCSKTYT